MAQTTQSTLRERIADAEKILDRNMFWIARTDSRTNLIFGVNSALFGILFGTIPKIQDINLFMAICFGVFMLLIALSFKSLYHSFYPELNAPNNSLIFFGTIRSRSPSGFKAEFGGLSDQDYLDDVLSQIHANATIIQKKFDEIKKALTFTASSIPFWVASIIQFRFIG